MSITLHTIYSCYLDLWHLSIKISCLVPSCSAVKKKVVSLVEEFLTYSHILCMMGSLSDLSVTLWPTRTSMCSSMMLCWSLSPVEILRSQPQGSPVPLRNWRRRTEKLGGQDLRHSFMYALLIGIKSTLALENDTVPKVVERKLFSFWHTYQSLSYVCLFLPNGYFLPQLCWSVYC